MLGVDCPRVGSYAGTRRPTKEKLVGGWLSSAADDALWVEWRLSGVGRLSPIARDYCMVMIVTLICIFISRDLVVPRE